MTGETGALVWLEKTGAGLPLQLFLNKSDSSDVSETAGPCFARVSIVLGASFNSREISSPPDKKMAAQHLWRVGTIGGFDSGWLNIQYCQSEFLLIKWSFSSSTYLTPPCCLVANVNSCLYDLLSRPWVDLQDSRHLSVAAATVKP